MKFEPNKVYIIEYTEEEFALIEQACMMTELDASAFAVDAAQPMYAHLYAPVDFVRVDDDGEELEITPVHFLRVVALARARAICATSKH